MLSKVTVEEDEGERDESAEIKVTLDPEKASNLITSQSSNNKWVDGYLKEDRFRPPFGFKPAKQKLKLSHKALGVMFNKCGGEEYIAYLILMRSYSKVEGFTQGTGADV